MQHCRCQDGKILCDSTTDLHHSDWVHYIPFIAVLSHLSTMRVIRKLYDLVYNFRLIHHLIHIAVQKFFEFLGFATF
ncbi:hypothetical protein D3C86_1755800 [compost metagenome]